MTKEEKQLLLKDLCARLPYGVKCRFENKTKEFSREGANGLLVDFDELYCYWFNEGLILPYLRPLSSMTKEEREYLEELSNFKATPSVVRDKVDFYLEHHLDYRGLIPMGLALEAKEGMYKTK